MPELKLDKKRRSNRIPARFVPYSSTIAKQLDVLFNRAYDKENNISKGDHAAISMSRLRNSCITLLHLLPLALERVNTNTASAITSEGFDALLDFEIWQEIEYFCVNELINVKLPAYATRVEEALENIVKFHLNNNKISAPFRLTNESISIDLVKLHKLGFHQLKEIRELLQRYLDHLSLLEAGIKNSSIRDNILRTSSAIIGLCQHDNFSKTKQAKQPLVETLRDKAFISPLISNSHLGPFLKYLHPDVWGAAKINYLKTEAEISSYARSISPIFGEEIDAFLKNQLANAPAPKKAKVKSASLSFLKWLHNGGDITRPTVVLLSKYGISGLAANDKKIFKFLYKLYQDASIKRKNQYLLILNAALSLYHFITGKKIILYSLLPYSLVYYLKESDTTQYQRLEWVYNNTNKYYQNLAEYHDVFTKRIDGESIGIITLKGYIFDMASALKNNVSSLTDKQMELIAQNGVHAFVENNFEILKAIREAIQLKSKRNDLSISTAKQYQSAIDKLLTFYGLDTIISFPVSTELREQHQAQLSQNQNRLYSYQDVVKLAYFIEIGLSSEKFLTVKEKIALYAAKVMLKTGWNLTPTLELNTTDLLFLNTPLHSNKTPAIRLFKRRADYQTQWHKFEVNAENIEKEGILADEIVASVFFDIKSAIELTASYQPSASNLSKRIFVYPQTNNLGNKEVLVLSAGRFKLTINKILAELGCEVIFSVNKIRKTGLNYIYRKVAKEFKWYQKASQHSYATFLRHYLMQDDKDVAKTINRATKTMADYFVRDVTDNVIILMTPPDNGKKVPNGVCTDSKEKSVVRAFESKNRKLLSQRDANEQACADFNACLWCPFYRCIADKEHVWKLLSYRDFVVADMESSAATFDGVTEQLENIKQLKNRINSILNDIAKIDFQAVIDGKELLKAEGIHPHWKDTGLL